MFKTIVGEGFSEITKKKSKFICHAYHVETVEKAEEIIKELRKKYHDARHNCYAYRILKDNVSRSSDDGEPSGTAGTPMLNILEGRELTNILVVVTRYFGGILLGTGGLVRAYSSATTECLENSNIVSQELGLEIKFSISYKELEEVKYQLKNRGININDIIYDEKVQIIAEGKEEEIRKIMNEKISERIVLNNIILLGEKYISIVE